MQIWTNIICFMMLFPCRNAVGHGGARLWGLSGAGVFPQCAGLSAGQSESTAWRRPSLRPLHPRSGPGVQGPSVCAGCIVTLLPRPGIYLLRPRWCKRSLETNWRSLWLYMDSSPCLLLLGLISDILLGNSYFSCWQTLKEIQSDWLNSDWYSD